MKAFELIDQPEKWTQGATAKDGRGTWVWHNSPEAICWCALGAMAKCYDDVESYCAEVKKIRDILDMPIAIWNDTSDWQTVYEMLKKLDI